jgi:hypothetical protein
MGLGSRLAALVLAAVCTAGCVGDAFVCGTHAQCLFGGVLGSCEPVGYCSFPAPECDSGRRFGDYASDELRNLCVGAESPDLGVTDLAEADLAQPDLALPAPDLKGLDLTGADLLITPADMSMPADMAGACPVGAVICDDFETGDTSKWNTPDVEAPSTISVDKVQVHSPMHSLHGVSPANGSNESRALVSKAFNKAPPMTLSVRLWLYAQTTPGRYGLFLGLRKNGSANLNLGTNQNNMIAMTVNDGSQPDVISATALPLMQWVCVQLRVDYPTTTPSQGRVRVYLGKTQVLDFVPASLVSDGIVQVGLVRAPGDDALALFEDDVVAAYEDTPCP